MRGINPEAVKRFNEAASAYRQGDYRRSAEAYEAGIQLCPAPPLNPCLDLAKPLEMLGEWDAALDALRKALAHDPHHPIAQRRFERISQKKAAFGALAQSLNRPSSPDAPLYNVSTEEGVLPAMAQIAQTALRLAWGDFAAAFGRRVQGALHVHLAPSRSPSRGDLPIWAAGLTRGNRIFLFLLRPDPDVGLLVSLLRHEFVHAALNEAAPGRCPVWLEEALAEAFAKPMMEWERKLLAADAAQGRLRPFDELTSPFMTLPRGAAKAAYRQCAALGEMLLRGGDAEMPARLFAGLARGAAVDELFFAEVGRYTLKLEDMLF